MVCLLVFAIATKSKMQTRFAEHKARKPGLLIGGAIFTFLLFLVLITPSGERLDSDVRLTDLPCDPV